MSAVAVAAAAAAAAVAVAGGAGLPAAARAATAGAGAGPAGISSAAAASAAHLLSAVACPAVKDCVAVGESDPADEAGTPFATRWNGSAWKSLAAPLPAGGVSGSFGALSCVSAKFCLAIGGYATATASLPLGEAWNGTSWKAVTVTAPAGNSQLLDVACVSATWCTATGSTDLPAGGVVAFTDHWNGAKWSAAQVAVPKGSSGVAAGPISCVSASWCQAGLDAYVTKDLTEVSGTTYADTWNGKTWTAVKLALAPAADLPEIASDTCLTKKDCTVTGQSLTAGGWHTIAAADNGTKWTITTLPGTDVNMSGLACPSAKSCLAAGSQGADAYGDGGKAYVESWNGGRWKGAKVPGPAGKNTELVDIACASSGYCVTIGQTRTPGTLGAGFADLWNGKSWKLTPAF